MSNTRSEPTPTISHTFPDTNPGFTASDYEFLSENENVRYLNSTRFPYGVQPNDNPKLIGHAVIKKDDNGQKIALQYAIPSDPNGAAPIVVELTDIQEITRYGMTRYRAKAKGRDVYAKRYTEAMLDDGSNVTLAYFSDSEKQGQEPFWGSDPQKPIKLFKDDKLENEKQPKRKGGKELAIEPESVWERDKIKVRKPTQNEVMKQSACEAVQAFYKEMKSKLTDDFIKVLEKSINAPLKDVFKSNSRDEWLHLYAHSLTPMSQDPQRKDNLAAAPKWANTEMMLLERVVKWFALNRPETFQSIKADFQMLRKTELAKHISYMVTIEDKEKWVKFIQNIDPFQKFPLYRKATDLAQTVAITQSYLNGVEPVSQQTIGHAAQANSSRSRSSSFASATTAVTTSTSTSTISCSEDSRNPTATFKGLDTMFSSRKYYPTQFEHENSIVRITTSSYRANYDAPWTGPESQSWSGTGFVVERQGKIYVVTNAHVVENSIRNGVRFANDYQKFTAKPVCISYQSDLALLEVKDPEFLKKAKPLSLGKMVNLREKVFTIGFPRGGKELCITKGIVSRIEDGDYSMSNSEMLQVQIDAAVNPGNSGGPVMSNGKVVGVAFQGDWIGQNMNYIIPMPILERFLQEALNGQPYHGYPVLPITVQHLRNVALRKFYGMTEKQTGVRVKSIDFLSDAHSKLELGDILLEIDSHPISNEGKIDIEGIGNCIHMDYVTHRKFIGDNVALKVIRKNAKTQKFETKLINVRLDCTPHQAEVVPQCEHDKLPSFYISSGLCLVPLTRNLVEDGNGDDFLNYVVDEGCSIVDSSKRFENEQIVIIKNVFDCDETDGYEEYENAIIKKINGTVIRNMQDAIQALESNKNEMHEIVTSRNNTLIIKNMSKAEHEALMRTHMVDRDCSDDLLPFSNRKHKEKLKLAELAEAMSEESEEQVETRRKGHMQGKSGHTPGHAHYLAAISQLEARYQHGHSQNAEADYSSDDEASISLGSSSSRSSDSDESSIDESKGKEKERPKHHESRKHDDRNRLFNKRKREESSESESEEEMKHRDKRHRR